MTVNQLFDNTTVDYFLLYQQAGHDNKYLVILSPMIDRAI